MEPSGDLSVDLGDWSVRTFRSGGLALDGGAMFGSVPRPMWERLVPPDAHHRIPLALRLLVLENRAENRLVLVDGGMGDKEYEAFRERFAVEGPPLRAALTEAGIDPEAITDVIVTHLHFDHVGGLVELPNARILVQAKEWASRTDVRMVESGAYNPSDIDLGHDVTQVDGDHDVFGDGTLVCLLTDGHTAGHQSVRVRTEAGTFVICGDCCYLRRMLTDRHLPPFGVDRSRQLQSIHRMAREQRAGAKLIFGHDPDQWMSITEHGLSDRV